MRKTIYLIDGTAYIHRAYHAIRNLTNSNGLPTNAVYGFTRMLIKLLEDRNPQYIVILFDTKGPTFRHKMFDKYKANRPPMPEDMALQIPYIKEITSAFNLSQIEMPGFEADDLIGTLACKAEKAGFDVVMVTGDKDFMQLVTERITIWDPMKEKVINPDTIRSGMGVEPGQLIDVMGLSGDTADNIPGVPGVGPKTALKLIKTFGSLTKLYDRVDTIAPKKQHENLVNFKKQAFLSQQLVTIDTRAPVDFKPEHFIIKKPDNTSLAGLFKKLEFRQLQKAYPAKSDLSRKNYRAVMDENDLAKLIARLQAAEIFALDTETTSKNPMVAGLVGLSFAITPHEAFYIPCGHHYPEYDWMVLLRHGIDLKGVTFDTMLASYLLNPSKRAHGLDQIALDFLDHTTISYQDVTGKDKTDGGFARVPIEKATPYACEDADITLMAKNILARELDDADLMDLFKNVEMPLVPVLMSMEMQGVSVDRERL
ncbi:MAG: DNA polymerase I, partial [Deltaproteobacteria bacterium]|nr:DNA polymerase I [Deltaproteobacteria bacterium]